jgi:hypothetical protein
MTDSREIILTEQQEDHGVEAIGKLIEVLRPLNAETRTNVLQFVFKALNITMPGVPSAPAYVPAPPGAPQVHTPPPAHQPPPQGGVTDLRSLTEQKQPRTANHMVAVMAYYLAHYTSERRDYITPDDIKKYFPQANFELPTSPPSQTLVNAKNAGYLEQIATGQYRLNPVGNNLVTHRLPGGEANAGSGTRRRAAKKARATKKKNAKK